MQLRNLRSAEVAHVFDELAYVATEKNIISRGRKKVNFANELRIKTMQTLWWTQPQVCWVERVLEKKLERFGTGKSQVRTYGEPAPCSLCTVNKPVPASTMELCLVLQT